MTKNKHKIAIVSTSLGSGGAERFAALLSFMLEKLDFEVHNIIINDAVDYEYSGKLLNLGQQCKNHSFLFRKITKGVLLHRYLNENGITNIIDNRPRNHLIREFITKWIYGKRKKQYVVHSYKLDNYFPKTVFWARILYQNTDKIICVSHSIEEKVRQDFGLKNTITIHNPYSFPKKIEFKNQDLNSDKYIMFLGRFDEKVKNFSLMLEAFSISKIYRKGFHLLLMGNGRDLDFIQNKIKMLKIEPFVKMLPFKNNPFEQVHHAKFTILTSHYEGFPLSIVESLALGTPVIAVDCNSGPREIINHEHNGLLIENDNPQAFSDAMNRLIDDSILYDFCKKNASKSVEHLSLDIISKQWESVLS